MMQNIENGGRAGDVLSSHEHRFNLGQDTIPKTDGVGDLDPLHFMGSYKTI